MLVEVLCIGLCSWCSRADPHPLGQRDRHAARRSGHLYQHRADTKARVYGSSATG